MDAATEASAAGIRALWISLAVLMATAPIQAAVVAISGSVALLGDTLHNAADALTALPLGWNWADPGAACSSRSRSSSCSARRPASSTGA